MSVNLIKEEIIFKTINDNWTLILNSHNLKFFKKRQSFFKEMLKDFQKMIEANFEQLRSTNGKLKVLSREELGLYRWRDSSKSCRIVFKLDYDKKIIELTRTETWTKSYHQKPT